VLSCTFNIHVAEVVVHVVAIDGAELHIRLSGRIVVGVNVILILSLKVV